MTGAPSAIVSHQTENQGDLAVLALPGGGVIVAGDQDGYTTIGTPGTLTLRQTSYDVFVMGTNAAHEQIWAKWLGGGTTDNAEYLRSMDLDPWGRVVFAAESYSVGAKFDGVDVPGAGTDASFPGFSVIGKLDEAGNTLWVKAIGAANKGVRATHCRFAPDGDVLFSGSIDPSATPNFGGGAVTPSVHARGMTVRWTP
jgi:hypothetical protein